MLNIKASISSSIYFNLLIDPLILFANHDAAWTNFFLKRSLIRTAETTFLGPVASLGLLITKLLAYSIVEPPPSRFIALKQLILYISLANSGIVSPLEPGNRPSTTTKYKLLFISVQIALRGCLKLIILSILKFYTLFVIIYASFMRMGPAPIPSFTFQRTP
jgi:hypothetical protein